MRCVISYLKMRQTAFIGWAYSPPPEPLAGFQHVHEGMQWNGMGRIGKERGEGVKVWSPYCEILRALLRSRGFFLQAFREIKAAGERRTVQVITLKSFVMHLGLMSLVACCGRVEYSPLLSTTTTEFAARSSNLWMWHFMRLAPLTPACLIHG